MKQVGNSSNKKPFKIVLFTQSANNNVNICRVSFSSKKKPLFTWTTELLGNLSVIKKNRKDWEATINLLPERFVRLRVWFEKTNVKTVILHSEFCFKQSYLYIEQRKLLQPKGLIKSLCTYLRIVFPPAQRTLSIKQDIIQEVTYVTPAPAQGNNSRLILVDVRRLPPLGSCAGLVSFHANYSPDVG